MTLLAGFPRGSSGSLKHHAATQFSRLISSPSPTISFSTKLSFLHDCDSWNSPQCCGNQHLPIPFTKQLLQKQTPSLVRERAIRTLVSHKQSSASLLALSLLKQDGFHPMLSNTKTSLVTHKPEPLHSCFPTYQHTKRHSNNYTSFTYCLQELPALTVTHLQVGKNAEYLHYRWELIITNCTTN